MSRINFRKHTFSVKETDPRVCNHQGCAKNAALLYEDIRGKRILSFLLEEKNKISIINCTAHELQLIVYYHMINYR